MPTSRAVIPTWSDFASQGTFGIWRCFRLSQPGLEVGNATGI